MASVVVAAYNAVLSALRVEKRSVAASRDHVYVLSYVSAETVTSGNIEILTCRALFRTAPRHLKKAFG